MLFKLACFLTFIPFLILCEYTKQDIDFSEECLTVADYYQNETDYCTNFNNTCQSIYKSKKHCRSVDLMCHPQYGGWCVLMDCKEYTPDLKIRKYQAPVEIWNSNRSSISMHHLLYSYDCQRTALAVSYANAYSGSPHTLSTEGYEDKFEHCCAAHHRRLEAKFGTVCRENISMSCAFRECSDEDDTVKHKGGLVRLTTVSEKDVDVTELAIDAVTHTYASFNITTGFCQHFRNQCIRILERYFGGGKFAIKENTCLPDEKVACILMNVADMDKKIVNRKIVKMNTTVTGDTLDGTGLAAEYAHRMNGSYCDNFFDGCTMFMNVHNILMHNYQLKEVTCDTCILVKNSTTMASGVLTGSPAPRAQGKLRLTAENEKSILMDYGNHSIPAMMMVYSMYPTQETMHSVLSYQCSIFYHALSANIENVCWKNTTVTFNGTVINCQFHRCGQDEEKETDQLTVRYKDVSEKDIDVTALARDLLLTNINSYMNIYSHYCEKFHAYCHQILDRYFYNKMDYQVKESTCDSESMTIPAQSACILIRVGDK